ncbi:MAG: hypothetical protein KDH20_12975 [Rhodocyclaceae bacterium]|nr:hypothetical protein [Rhodocyclaceae bacterium]
MSEGRDEDLIRRAGASLDRSVEALDPATRAALAVARRRALGQGAKPAWRWPAFASPAAGLAFALLLALGVLLWPAAAPVPGLTPPVLAEAEFEVLDLLAVTDPAELVDEPDFYLWVEGELAEEGGQHAG